MDKIITDREWIDFVDKNIVDDDIFELIAIRIISNYQITEREISIYDSFSEIIEKKIKKIKGCR